MLPNGSLIINNVTVEHEQGYIVRLVLPTGEVQHHNISVEVYGKYSACSYIDDVQVM